MNQASNDSAQSNVIISIDLDTEAIETSRLQMKSAVGGARVHFFQDDAASAVQNLASIKRKFNFAFVDHSHRYEQVLSACEQLHRVVEIDGFALFHDFNDPRNSQEQEVEYGVYQGVMDGTGLFRRIGPC